MKAWGLFKNKTQSTYKIYSFAQLTLPQRFQEI